MRKKVTQTRKGKDGDILVLCNKSEAWLVTKEDAILEIEKAGNPNSPCYVEIGRNKVLIHSVKDPVRGKYLRTDPDKTPINNLSELPDW